MQTTVTKAGNAPDLLSGILSVQVRNEDKITEQDRLYCQMQQELLYKTLDQIDRWYAVFKEEAEQYQAERKFHYEENGKVSMRDFYTYHNDRDDYSHNEFKPFDLINDLVDKNRNANANFAGRIISYFNRTYNVSVPEYKIDEKTLQMGSRPSGSPSEGGPLSLLSMTTRHHDDLWPLVVSEFFGARPNAGNATILGRVRLQHDG